MDSKEVGSEKRASAHFSPVSCVEIKLKRASVASETLIKGNLLETHNEPR